MMINLTNSVLHAVTRSCVAQGRWVALAAVALISAAGCVDQNPLSEVTDQAPSAPIASLARGQAILARLDAAAVYNQESKQLVLVDGVTSVDVEVAHVVSETNRYLRRTGDTGDLDPDVVAALIDANVPRGAVAEIPGSGFSTVSGPLASFCSPITCGGTFNSSEDVKKTLKSWSFYNVWQSWYGGNEWDFARTTKGCTFKYSNPLRDEAVVCRSNCKGGCAKDGKWTYYVEKGEPDPAGAWCATASWIVWTAYYHKQC